MAALALLYDVHGNLAALRAVLDDARRQGAARFVLGGDYALFGPWPQETLAALRELAQATWIRGNGERWTASPDQAPDDPVVQGAIASCRESVGPEVSRLARLAETATEGDVLYCHGSPASDVRSFMPEPADDEAELLDGVRARRLVFGHTHLPFRRMTPDGVELVNPGSVGMPFDGDPRAAYALVADNGELEHRRVDYDHLGAAAAVRDRFPGDWTQTVAGRIERAAF